MPRQHQQILIARDQKVGSPALGQVEKRLVLRVAAKNLARSRNLDRLAKWQVISQGFKLLVGEKPEPRIGENSRQLCGRATGDKWHAVFGLPMIDEPAKTPPCKQQSGEDDVGVEDDSRLGGSAHWS